MTNTPSDTRTAFIRDLREFANWLETHETAPVSACVSVAVGVNTADEFRAAGRRMGSAQKELYGDWASLVKMFGAIRYEIFVSRGQVCERKVVGTRTIPAHTEELIEWECKESLLAPEDGA